MKKISHAILALIIAAVSCFAFVGCGRIMEDKDAIELMKNITTDASTITTINIDKIEKGLDESITTSIKWRSKAYLKEETTEITESEGAAPSKLTTMQYLFKEKDTALAAIEFDSESNVNTKFEFISETFFESFITEAQKIIYNDFKLPENESNIVFIEKKTVGYHCVYKIENLTYTVSFSPISKATEVFTGKYRISYLKIKDGDTGFMTEIKFEYPTLTSTLQPIEKPESTVKTDIKFDWITEETNVPEPPVVVPEPEV